MYCLFSDTLVFVYVERLIIKISGLIRSKYITSCKLNFYTDTAIQHLEATELTQTYS